MLQPVIKKALSDNAKESLRQSIFDMDLSGGGKLPPEQDLARRLNVSRGTIRTALQDLEQEGLVLRIHGKGTFINPEALRIRANIGGMTEFSSVIQQNGYDPGMKLLSVRQEAASESIVKHLHLSVGALLIRVEKLYFADKLPVILSIAWVPASLFPQLPSEEDWASHNNFGLLYLQAEKVITHDIVDISSVSREEMESQLCHKSAMACRSMLCLEACAFDQDNIPAIFGKAFYDTSRIRFQLFRSQEANL
ncbi:GntR family transcriptional regulator [Oscillibacter sp. MSJ-2]|uniref:GntR family transcriptional regulator n=1 Tax=Dysosmobacter acutus TaxID=2841504 RepID=A0ABS6F5I2_9FIRM|nr:GntR family transcriptional regulator [Dysosmobacter acutus]MBU5625553.1 GntR family transcriptional regulator [Dysosmobacter acutus]